METTDLQTFLRDAHNSLSTNLKNPGYHVLTITKGEKGEITKVVEELLEFHDADKQQNKIVMAVELSDAILAIELVAKKYLPEISFEDILKMSRATKRALESGNRKTQEPK